MAHRQPPPTRPWRASAGSNATLHHAASPHQIHATPSAHASRHCSAAPQAQQLAILEHCIRRTVPSMPLTRRPAVSVAAAAGAVALTAAGGRRGAAAETALDSASNPWRHTFSQAVLQGRHADGGQVTELGLKGRLSEQLAWRAVTVRPLLLKGKPHLQFSYCTRTQDLVKNEELGSPGAAARLQELLHQGLPFTAITLRTMTQASLAVYSVEVTRSGRTILHRHPVPAAPALAASLSASPPAPSPTAAATATSPPPPVAAVARPATALTLAPPPVHPSLGAWAAGRAVGPSSVPAASTAPAPPTAAAAAGAWAAGAGAASAAGGCRLISLGQATGSSRQAGSGPPAGLQLLSHDRVKALPIPPDQPHPFLQALGLQTAQGRVKADRADKLAQVNEFLKLLEHTDRLHQLLPSSPLQPHQHPTSAPPLESPPGAGAGAAEGGGPGGAAAATGSGCPAGGGVVRILDCGCGAAYLTLGTWHYLNNVLGIAAHITGIDSNAVLMAKSNRYCQQLGLGGHQAQFLASPIAGYAPPQPPHVILALHACDTATDEALALGVKQGAPIIMAVPCCHNHLHRQLAGSKAMVAPFGPVMGHGILRQRMLDVLTDSLRALLLRIVGYKVDVVEFVSAEHTPRNVLIRAVRRGPAGYVSTTDTSGASKSAETADGDTEPTPSMMGSGSSSNDSSSSGTSSPGVDKLPDQASTKVTLQLVEEYKALTSFWGVRPHLETLLEAELQQLLSM
ncbi:hypothetical protein QJQ45_025624 [Haematococcus lacustris]|nr:hypothetical protein QJQ45_025624 [Haematococcus lacustris]